MKVLFIPVSGKVGIGEYSRSLIIANELKSQVAEVDIAFILSREAPYAMTCPFSVYQTDLSATKCTKQVTQIMADYKPDVVVFDSSGRAKQLAFAKKLGVKTVFLSYYDKKRTQGLRLNRLSHIDVHFVTQLPIFISSLTRWQHLKLKVKRIAPPRCIGSVFSPITKEHSKKILNQYGLKQKEYFFVSSGSGAHKVLSGAYVSDVFFNAVKTQASSSMKVVQVFGGLYPKNLPKNENMICLQSLKNDEFIALLAGSKGAIVTGGDTLGQTLSLHIPSVSVAVAKDQLARVNKASELGLCLSADQNEESIRQAFLELVSETTYHNFLKKLKQLALGESATNEIVNAIVELAEAG